MDGSLLIRRPVLRLDKRRNNVNGWWFFDVGRKDDRLLADLFQEYAIDV